MNAAAALTADTQRAPPAPPGHHPTLVQSCLATTWVPFERLWFERSPVELAVALLGQLVVRDVDGDLRIARIVETEAYAGTDDRASHARAGRTGRTEPMFGPAGHAYVYLVYGIHHCLNVVAETDGVPAAVLIRAAEPVAGVDGIRRARHEPRTLDARLLAGPALLCAGLSIDRGLDRQDLTTGRALWICPDPGRPVPDGMVARGPRIGVGYAGPGWADRPWRFGLAGNTAVSRPFPASLRAGRATSSVTTSQPPARRASQPPA